MKSGSLIPIFIVAILVEGCFSYSFTGASVPPHLKTIGIPIALDQSGFGDPILRDEFSRQLVDVFVQDNSLQIADKTTSDALLETVITAVRNTPEVVQGGDAVSKWKIAVTVRATFQDLRLKKKVWEKDFSQFGLYDASAGLTGRTEGLKEAIRKLTEDILLESVSGW